MLCIFYHNKISIKKYKIQSLMTNYETVQVLVENHSYQKPQRPQTEYKKTNANIKMTEMLQLSDKDLKAGFPWWCSG